MIEIINDEKYGFVFVDENNNKWSVDLYSKLEAQKASETLVNCANCYNCSNLVNCVNCIECWGCNDCRNCEYCSWCDFCDSCVDCHHSVYQCSVLGFKTDNGYWNISWR